MYGLKNLAAKPCFDANMHYGKNVFCFNIVSLQFHVKYFKHQQTCKFWQRLNFKTESVYVWLIAKTYFVLT